MARPPQLIRAALQQADRGHILQALAGFAGKPAHSWLTSRNPGRLGTLPTSWNKTRGYLPQVFVDALALSAPNHCVDGWSYLARATSAFLAGDMHSCRHLSYYAQLRAALSILGSMGIGLFNGLNYAIDDTGSTVRIDTAGRGSGIRTHVAVWDVLNAWVSEPTTARIFLDMVRIGNSTLATCLDAIWPGTSTSGAASSLIDAWGFDLRRGKLDHAARNQSSYDPQLLRPQLDNPKDRIEYIESVWRLLEPTSSTSFDLLDRHLLRSMLWHLGDVVHPGGARSAGPISRRYDQLPPNVQMIASQNFLTGLSEPDIPTLLTSAKATGTPASATEMLSRATLLLRAATAFTITNFHDAGVRIGTGQLSQWLDPIAVSRGFWVRGAPLASPADLWEDVRLALDDMTASANPPPLSLREWLDRKDNGLPIVTQTERIGIWSLGA